MMMKNKHRNQREESSNILIFSYFDRLTLINCNFASWQSLTGCIAAKVEGKTLKHMQFGGVLQHLGYLQF